MTERKVQTEPEPSPLEITVSVGRTFNIGSYESLRLDVSVRATLNYGLSIEAATDKLLPHIKESLRKAYLDHVDKHGKGKDL